MADSLFVIWTFNNSPNFKDNVHQSQYRYNTDIILIMKIQNVNI